MTPFDAVLAALPAFRIRDAEGWRVAPGLRVSEHFAVTKGVETDSLRDKWSLSHIPSGYTMGWAKDGEILIWLALHMEQAGGDLWASEKPWEVPGYWGLVQERVRLFGHALALDPAGNFGW